MFFCFRIIQVLFLRIYQWWGMALLFTMKKYEVSSQIYIGFVFFPRFLFFLKKADEVKLCAIFSRNTISFFSQILFRIFHTEIKKSHFLCLFAISNYFFFCYFFRHICYNLIKLRNIVKELFLQSSDICVPVVDLQQIQLPECKCVCIIFMSDWVCNGDSMSFIQMDNHSR